MSIQGQRIRAYRVDLASRLSLGSSTFPVESNKLLQSDPTGVYYANGLSWDESTDDVLNGLYYSLIHFNDVRYSMRRLYFRISMDLFCTSNGGPATRSIQGSVYLMTTDWNPQTVNWSNMPAPSGRSVTLRGQATNIQFDNDIRTGCSVACAYEVPPSADPYYGLLVKLDSYSDSPPNAQPFMQLSGLFLVDNE